MMKAIFYGSVFATDTAGAAAQGDRSDGPGWHTNYRPGREKRRLSSFATVLHNERSFGSQGNRAASACRVEVVMIRVSIASPQDVVAIDRTQMRQTAKTV